MPFFCNCLLILMQIILMGYTLSVFHKKMIITSMVNFVKKTFEFIDEPLAFTCSCTDVFPRMTGGN